MFEHKHVCVCGHLGAILGHNQFPRASGFMLSAGRRSQPTDGSYYSSTEHSEWSCLLLPATRCGESKLATMISRTDVCNNPTNLTKKTLWNNLSSVPLSQFSNASMLISGLSGFIQNFEMESRNLNIKSPVIKCKGGLRGATGLPFIILLKRKVSWSKKVFGPTLDSNLSPPVIKWNILTRGVE